MKEHLYGWILDQEMNGRLLAISYLYLSICRNLHSLYTKTVHRIDFRHFKTIECTILIKHKIVVSFQSYCKRCKILQQSRLIVFSEIRKQKRTRHIIKKRHQSQTESYKWTTIRKIGVWRLSLSSILHMVTAKPSFV